MIAELMDRFVELATTWLWLVLLATWRALPILVLVTGLALALRRKLAPSLHALLLTIVVVRLLLPVSVGSPLSLHKPIDNWFSSDSGESINRNRQMLVRDHKYALLPNVNSIEAQDAPSRVHAQPSRTDDYAWQEILYAAVLLVVISVSIGLLFRGVLSHIQFAIRLRSCRLLDDQSLIDLLLRECDSLAVGRRPNLREVPLLAAPAVFGLFRQTICFPPNLIETLNEQELRWILRHELAHMRRRDIPVMVTASIAGACHWFNPIVWLVVSRLRAAMETAADRLALQSLSPNEAVAYGNFLLRLAESGVATRKSSTLGLLPFASGSNLKWRIEILMRGSKPHSMIAKPLAVVTVTVVALMGLTDAREVIHQITPEVHLISSDLSESRVDHVDFDAWHTDEIDVPSYVVTYDIDSVLESMPRAITESMKDLEMQLTCWIPFPTVFREKIRVEGRVLIADLTAHQHQMMEQTLQAWKYGEPKQIAIEARIIQTSIGIASAIDWAGRRLETLHVKGIGPALAARITDNELKELIRAVQEDWRGNVMFAPKVTVFDGQTAAVADQVQRPFVTGVEPKADGRMQPVISVVDDGLRFVLTPRLADDNSLTLAFEVRSSNIRKVSYANLPFRHSDQKESRFTVQVPSTEQYEVSSAVKLAAGETIVVAIPRVFNLEPGADAETTMIVALTPRVIATQETSVAASPSQ